MDTRLYVGLRRLTHHSHSRFEVQLPFFERGEFPKTIINGTEEIVLKNPWEGRGNAAPFDHPFYLIIMVSVFIMPYDSSSDLRAFGMRVVSIWDRVQILLAYLPRFHFAYLLCHLFRPFHSMSRAGLLDRHMSAIRFICLLDSEVAYWQISQRHSSFFKRLAGADIRIDISFPVHLSYVRQLCPGSPTFSWPPYGGLSGRSFPSTVPIFLGCAASFLCIYLLPAVEQLFDAVLGLPPFRRYVLSAPAHLAVPMLCSYRLRPYLFERLLIVSASVRFLHVAALTLHKSRPYLHSGLVTLCDGGIYRHICLTSIGGTVDDILVVSVDQRVVPDGVGNKPWLDQSTSECISTMFV
ncbi:glycoside hydrolase family protein [Salix suchowensis]|nr:glycoside hydrolase family protein [Salix suchowensis]